METIIAFFESGDIWAIIIKVLLTALITAAIGFICTLIGKLIAKCKNSKLMKHARIAVRAAEMKFPNEGKKMGPEKMAYVMDYLAITFPKIKSNQYLYNIAEAAVYELNNQNIKEVAKQEFEEKYGELPQDTALNTSEESTETQNINVEAIANIATAVSKKSNTDIKGFDLKSF